MKKRKQEYIADALSEIEDTFIEEAISYKKSRMWIGKKEWAALGAFAAVLVLTVTTYMWLPMRELNKSTEAVSCVEGAMPENAMEGNANTEGIREESAKQESAMEGNANTEGIKEESAKQESAMEGNANTEGIREESAKQESAMLGNAEESTKEEVAENPIGVTAKASEVTSAGMILLLIQEGGSVTGILQTGEAYWLEQEIDGEWVKMQQQYDVFKEAAYTIESNTTTVLEIDWEGRYGVLEAGTYRLRKEIDDFREAGDYDSYDVYAQFVITQEAGG